MVRDNEDGERVIYQHVNKLEGFVGDDKGYLGPVIDFNLEIEERREDA